MQSVPIIPDSAPFTPEQRAWLNGFLAGLLNRSPLAAVPTTPAEKKKLCILFGTQTGNAEVLAKRAVKSAKAKGFDASVVDMAKADLGLLAKSQALLLLVSTYGEGDPPDSARALHAACATAEPGALAGIPYAVCALGDRNYTHFCKCGADFDERFKKLGAQRVSERIEIDGDPSHAFPAWLEKTLDAFPGGAATGSATPTLEAGATESLVHEEQWSRSRPFPAAVIEVRRLSAPESAKEVNHVALALGESGMTYEPGDALGVFPRNAPLLVAELLSILGCDGEEPVPDGTGGTCALRHALERLYDLGRPTDELLKLVPSSDRSLMPQVIDVLLKTESRPDASTVVRALRRLQPRLYSISSSPLKHPGEVHLTVGAVRYESQGRLRQGVCSTFLADQAALVGQVEVYIHPNRSFRLPEDPSTPVVMIGPGTGIAPFRAFLEDRESRNEGSRNWLLFGDQREAHDFLYREQIVAWRESGLLTKLDLAWSRDQAAKVYVQDRLRQEGAELWRWLQDGAHVYVCGDASRMAKDVERALLEIVAMHGQMTNEQAETYLAQLRETRRYQRDVY